MKALVMSFPMKECGVQNIADLGPLYGSNNLNISILTFVYFTWAKNTGCWRSLQNFHKSRNTSLCDKCRRISLSLFDFAECIQLRIIIVSASSCKEYQACFLEDLHWSSILTYQIYALNCCWKLLKWTGHIHQSWKECISHHSFRSDHSSK